jgi:hypothetical protein
MDTWMVTGMGRPRLRASQNKRRLVPRRSKRESKSMPGVINKHCQKITAAPTTPANAKDKITGHRLLAVKKPVNTETRRIINNEGEGLSHLACCAVKTTMPRQTRRKKMLSQSETEHNEAR